MKRPFASLALTIVCITTSLCAQTINDSSASPAPHPNVVPFVGLWDGTITYDGQNGNSTNRLVLEIKPVKGQEVLVEVEELGWGYPPMFGPGVVTPNAVSWVELDSHAGWALYRRFLGGLSTNGQIVGKCFWSTVEESATFSLKKTDLDAVKAFQAKNRKTLERLRTASGSAEFLQPVWRRIVPSALQWFDQTLGYPFKIIDDGINPDLEYANDLASALERQEDFFSQHLGSEMPLALEREPSLTIRQYLITFPKGFPASQQKFPLLFQLHGSGGSLRRIHFTAQPSGGERPFIVVKPITSGDWQPHSLNYLFATLKSLLPIDEDRVYLRGGSMGGFGTYAWAMSNPEIFAAISPISGAGDVFRASRLKSIPVWIFHGEQDNNVPIHLAATMTSALEACGANVKSSFYPDAKHALSGLVDEKALAVWFLEHTRSRAPIPADPIEDFQFNSQGVGRKEIVQLPAQRLASMRSARGPNSRFNPQFFSAPLYDVFRRAGFRPQGLVQQRILPSVAGGLTNLVLGLPKELDVKDLPEGVTIVDLPACRALSFVFATAVRTLAKEDELIQSALSEPMWKNETPTGEIRKTALNTQYGVWMGTNKQFLTRIDIVLK